MNTIIPAMTRRGTDPPTQQVLNLRHFSTGGRSGPLAGRAIVAVAVSPSVRGPAGASQHTLRSICSVAVRHDTTDHPTGIRWGYQLFGDGGWCR
jgi:hypothetical protein